MKTKSEWVNEREREKKRFESPLPVTLYGCKKKRVKENEIEIFNLFNFI